MNGLCGSYDLGCGRFLCGDAVVGIEADTDRSEICRDAGERSAHQPDFVIGGVQPRSRSDLGKVRCWNRTISGHDGFLRPQRFHFSTVRARQETSWALLI